MRHPGAVQRLLDAAVAGADDVGRDGADEGVKRPGTDRIDDALADPLRVEA